MASYNVASRKFVTIVTTSSDWNNSHADKPYPAWESHTGCTLDEIKKLDGNVKLLAIENQNPLLKKNWKQYEWLLKKAAGYGFLTACA